jgi:pSer/pThr/pTyr-binding forkhead associated (FHA) protein
LRNGDVISIENFDLRFVAPAEQTDETDKEEITESDLLEVKLLKKVLSALDKETSPSFEVLNGVEEAKKVYLTDDIPELVIGRDPECIFPIREHVISRRHAKVSGKWGGIAIRDLESKNGTFVNNRRIVEEYLHDGDRITLGTIVLMFRNPQEVNLAQLEQVPPKNKPQANVNDIPLAENTKAKPPGKSPQKDQTLSKDELKKEKKPVEKSYPTPKAPTKLFERYSPLEIGMIGFGVLFLVFSLITLVNLLFA